MLIGGWTEPAYRQQVATQIDGHSERQTTQQASAVKITNNSHANKNDNDLCRERYIFFVGEIDAGDMHENLTERARQVIGHHGFLLNHDDDDWYHQQDSAIHQPEQLFHGNFQDEMGYENNEQNNCKVPQDMVQGHIIGKIGMRRKDVGFQITPEQGHQKKEQGSGQANFEPYFFQFMFDGLDGIIQDHKLFFILNCLDFAIFICSVFAAPLMRQVRFAFLIIMRYPFEGRFANPRLSQYGSCNPDTHDCDGAQIHSQERISRDFFRWNDSRQGAQDQAGHEEAFGVIFMDNRQAA